MCQDIKIALLLGKPAINSLELVKLNIDGNLEIEPSINEMKAVTSSNKFMEEYPEVFHGLGCMTREPVQIELQENAVPYHLSAARPLMDPLKIELDRMEQLGVIRKVEEATDWCHPIVLVKKPTGELRICLDLTKLNVVSKRQYYQLESVDETS